MHERKRRAPRRERLECQMRHHTGVFSDGVQHHRILELRSGFADDVDALRLQLLEMCERSSIERHRTFP